MSEFTLPEGWVATTLKEICFLNPKNDLADDIDVGFLPMSGVPVNFGETTVFEVKKWSEVKKGYTHFADGDTIFAKITPCFENSKASIIEKFPNGYGSGSTEYFVLRPIGRLIESKLLLGLVRTNEFLRNGAANMSGSVGHKRVPKEFVENYIFPLAPLAEQKEIARKLDGLLAQVDTIKTRLDAIPNILKRFRQSVLAAAVSGRLTEEWRGGSDYDFIDDTFSIPKVWAKKSISDICEYITSGSRGWADFYSDSGSLFVRSQDINTDELVINDAAYVSLPESAEGKRTKIKKEDLLITITGANVTKCARVKIDLDDAYVSQHVALIRLSDTGLSAFVEKALKAQNAGRKQLLGYAYGGGKPGLNLQNIKDVVIGVPTNEEQTEIVCRVEQFFTYADQIEQRVKDAQLRVNHLTQSILAKAFRGELTAEWRAQNPELISGENSAAALLERIKAEREVASVKKKRGK